MNMNDKLQAMVAILDKHLGEDLTIIEFKDSSIADYFLICTAKNERHADSLIDYIKEELSEKYTIYRIDDKDPTWIVIDLNDIIVHIFTKEMRERYQLERLWSDQRVVEL